MKNRYLGLMAVLAGFVASAQAAAPAAITTLVTDAQDVYDSVQVVILSIIVFSVLIGMALKLKSRKG